MVREGQSLCVPPYLGGCSFILHIVMGGWARGWARHGAALLNLA